MTEFNFSATTSLERFDLSGKVALITGGAGLLGRKHAEAIAEAGGYVVIADIHEKLARAAAADIAHAGGHTAIGVGMDVTDPRQVREAVERVTQELGPIDILVNNAALTVKGGGDRARTYFAPFEDYPLDLWNEALNVNLTGAFLCCQAVGTIMAKRRSGVILNIASDVGSISPDHRIYEGVVSPHSGLPFNTPIAYATTKAGLINFTRYLATYWADRGVRVNCLSPGGVFADHDQAFVERLTFRIPLGRMARADEYKGAVLFLVSDASSYMTGANLIVDGGRTAW